MGCQAEPVEALRSKDGANSPEEPHSHHRRPERCQARMGEVNVRGE